VRSKKRRFHFSRALFSGIADVRDSCFASLHCYPTQKSEQWGSKSRDSDGSAVSNTTWLGYKVAYITQSAMCGRRFSFVKVLTFMLNGVLLMCVFSQKPGVIRRFLWIRVSVHTPALSRSAERDSPPGNEGTKPEFAFGRLAAFTKLKKARSSWAKNRLCHLPNPVSAHCVRVTWVPLIL
jgi:hypothetical protein